MIRSASLPLEAEAGIVEVIAGEYKGMKGSANTFSPIHLLNVKLNKDSGTDFTFPAAFNTALLVVEGELTVNKTEVVPSDHFALFQNDGEDFEIHTENGATVLVMSGENIHEPIAAHGPFVMNTRQEIMEAFDDFQKGKFGVLKD